jgi:Cu/Ag efflux protein CusF
MHRVSDLSRHFNVFREAHAKMGKNLSLAVSHFNSSTDELKKMDKDVAKITNGTGETAIEVEVVERPAIEA